MSVLAVTKKMPREEWLKLRTLGIGGSDAAAIAGLNPYKSAMAVWVEKTGGVADDDPEPSEAARWGNLLENTIAKEFQVRTGIRVRRKNAMLRHPEYPFMIANIDRETGDGGILEVKTTNARNRAQWGDGRVPDWYMLQGQHYLAVCGKSHVWFACLIGGQRLVTVRVERDEEIIQSLIEIERKFWDLVESRTPPEVDSTPASTEVLNKLYADAERGSCVDLPADAESLMRQYCLAQEEIARQESIKAEAANKLRAMLGSHEVGCLGANRVTWRTIERHALDTQALKEKRPEVYREFERTSTYRRFDVTIMEEGSHAD